MMPLVIPSAERFVLMDVSIMLWSIGSNKASGYDDLDVLYSDMELAEMDNLNYDWLDKAGWKSAFQQTHTLNVTGGSERATYYAGATYFDQGANLGDQSYKRYTYRAGVDVRLTNDIKLSSHGCR